MRVELDKEQILGENGQGLEVAILGFKGDIGRVSVQVFVEYYEGQLRVMVWDGTTEDPTYVHVIPAADESETEAEANELYNHSLDDANETDVETNRIE